jgi:glycosyltransferase involved in cell wall biosynthesis
MKILLDINACQTCSRHRGIGRYALNFSSAVAALPDNDDIRFLGMSTSNGSDLTIQNELGLQHAPNRFKTIELPTKPIAPHGLYPTLTERMQEISLQIAYHKFRADIVHNNSLFEDEITCPPPSRWGTTVTSTILYDLIPLLFANEYLQDQVTANNYRRKLSLLKELDLLFAISACSKADAERLLSIAPERIVNIGGACDPCFLADARITNDSRPLLTRLGIDRPFLYYIGNLDHRKNLDGLIKAFAHLPARLRHEHQLVITCPLRGDIKKRLQSLAVQHEITGNDMILTGGLTDAELVMMYKACKAFVFPSLYEGFGLPVLEAMTCGAAVIASDNSSIPEILQRRDARFDPNNLDDFTGVMARVLTNQDFRLDLIQYGHMRARDFSWAKSAKVAREAWLTAFENKRERRAMQTAPAPSPQAIALIPASSPQKFSRINLSVISPELLAETAPTTVENQTPLSTDRDWAIYLVNHLNEITHPSFYPTFCKQPGVIYLATAAVSPKHHAHRRNQVLHPTQDDLVRHILDLAPGIVFASSEVAATSEAYCPSDLSVHTLCEKTSGSSESLRAFLSTSFNRHTALNPVRLLQGCPEISFASSRVDHWLHSLQDTAIEMRQPRLYLDITQFRINWSDGLRTGIERVITRTLNNLLQEDREVWLVELSPNGLDFTSVTAASDGVYHATPYTVRFQRCDVLLIPEIRSTLNAEQPFWDKLHRAGVQIHAILYDLLFHKLPHYFPRELIAPYYKYLEAITKHADGIHAISKAVADELIDWIQTTPKHRSKPLHISFFPLGSDVEASGNPPEQSPAMLDLSAAVPTFISVGTIEPRKGHAYMLNAFEILWHQNIDVRLCYIGSNGWMVDEVVARIRNHPELNKRLFWLNNASDAELRYCYKHATALINASAGEGFGLPLVEAARHKVPILATQLPVFQEICGEGALYFDRDQPDSLASTVRSFLKSRAAGSLPDISLVKIATWEDSTKKLLSAIEGDYYVKIDANHRIAHPLPA